MATSKATLTNPAGNVHDSGLIRTIHVGVTPCAEFLVILCTFAGLVGNGPKSARCLRNYERIVQFRPVYWAKPVSKVIRA